MRQISITVRPENGFEVPHNDGYQVYSSILSCIQNTDENTSRHIHETPLHSISVSGLLGHFSGGRRPGHKYLSPNVSYEIRIGISDPQEEEIYESLILSLFLPDTKVSLDQGSLLVEKVKKRSLTYPDMIAEVTKYKRPVMAFKFLTPTCIQFRNSKVTEMFPHRVAVFHSLLSKWNQVCPEEMRMGIDLDDFGRYLIEKPEPESYQTYSVLVNTVHDAKRDHPRPIFKQGFVCECNYLVTPNAPITFKNAVTLLSLFAPFSGVGSSVARGCGQVSTMIQEGNNGRR
ncbi:CRISPR system precrRNA processing endoribonuclease RAMP protein Cas6 [Methanofollis aquaemaris]|nr:CRISPR system precrRNA processing endoribonuclease RAMP protein Cas6 [Methanofollis aquaemaris]